METSLDSTSHEEYDRVMTRTETLVAFDYGPIDVTDRGQLIELFRSAEAAELEHGLSWYVQAHEFCEHVASEQPVTVEQVAGIVAALSPRTEWELNKRRAVELIVTGDTIGLSNGRRKAQRILAGEAPLDVLAGPKVRAFYDNIASPLQSDAVVIDRHAFDAVFGVVTDDKTRKLLDRKGAYEQIADLYRTAARILGVRPHVAQAVIWVVWRRRYGYFAGSDFTKPEVRTQ